MSLPRAARPDTSGPIPSPLVPVARIALAPPILWSASAGSSTAWFARAVFAGDQADTNALADPPFRCFAAHGVDAAHYLMAGNTGLSQTRIDAVHSGRVGMANSACFHSYANLPVSRLGNRALDH